MAEANPERRMHLDRWADKLAVEGSTAGNPNDLLTTSEVAVWLRVSHQWLEILRQRGGGPPFIRQSRTRVRYKRADVLAWLDTRKHLCTSEYAAKTVKHPTKVDKREKQPA